MRVMDYIRTISHMYNGNILLHSPCKEDCKTDFPEELCSILKISNGIDETMLEPNTGERISITCVLYSYEQIVRESELYQKEYGIEGFIFTDDGAGNSYVLKSDGTVTCYNVLDDEEVQIAGSLYDFYKQQ